MDHKLLDKIVTLLDDKKAIDIKTIDIKEKSTLADFLIIANGTSSTHIKSLADYVQVELKKEGIAPYKVEGRDSNSWILMDYDNVLVNIFTQEDREHYNLEDLWENARS